MNFLHSSYHVNVINIKQEIIWTGGLRHQGGLPHLPLVPHLHVNRPLKNFFLVSYRTKFKILQGNCKTTNGECINYKTVDYMSRMALEKDDFRSFLPGNLGISCYKKLGRGARCINGENGPLTAKKCPH